MSIIWPIALIVAANIVYQICAKGVSKEMDAMASLTVTYLVGALLYHESITVNKILGMIICLVGLYVINR